jgi:guanine deaminase
MAGGRWVVRDRKLLTVDVESLRRKAEEAVERLKAANKEAKALGEALHPHVGHYCAGLV